MACRCSWVLLAALAWIVQPEGQTAGALFVGAGVANLIPCRVGEGGWRGASRWCSSSMSAMGGWRCRYWLWEARFLMLPAANAVHVLTTGAVGTMTLAVMTRASLGHSGRARHAGPMTVVMYVLVNLGAVVRVVAPASDAPTALTNLLLGMAAFGWSGAYLLFALIYGPILVRPSLEE